MNIQTDFGYNEIRVGNLTVYTGKIRIKGPHYSNNPLIKYVTDGNYTILSFETINPDLNDRLKKIISGYVYSLKKERLEQQYKWIKM